jgi:hypothetical protein
MANLTDAMRAEIRRQQEFRQSQCHVCGTPQGYCFCGKRGRNCGTLHAAVQQNCEHLKAAFTAALAARNTPGEKVEVAKPAEPSPYDKWEYGN